MKKDYEKKKMEKENKIMTSNWQCKGEVKCAITYKDEQSPGTSNYMEGFLIFVFIHFFKYLIQAYSPTLQTEAENQRSRPVKFDQNRTKVGKL